MIAFFSLHKLYQFSLFHKRQAEEAEDEMNRYASKYKMMQHEVAEAEERAENAENRLAQMRKQRARQSDF